LTVAISVNSNQYGQSYLFGFQSADAPSITGFVARGAELRYETETYSESHNAEGLVESVATTTQNKRKINATFMGYLLSTWDPNNAPTTFQFPPSTGRWYIVKGLTQPKRKGEFNEVSLEAVSYPLLTSP
jgi:DUF1680 family protein